MLRRGKTPRLSMTTQIVAGEHSSLRNRPRSRALSITLLARRGLGRFNRLLPNLNSLWRQKNYLRLHL